MSRVAGYGGGLPSQIDPSVEDRDRGRVRTFAMVDRNFISSNYNTLKYTTTKCHALNITNKQCKCHRQHV